jgi:YegS/Rv2252/BmrU family lipid kinase
MSSPTLGIIINPISGTGGRMRVARDRAERAAALVASRGLDAQVVMTERAGHAREIAETMLRDGIRTIAAWGGDGTVNEIASTLAFRDATLVIIPSGSGNGLSRELHIPFDPDGAIEIALTGREVRVDAGELDGRLFFNVAGIGLDARVAHRFAAEGLVHRGFRRYAAITVQELFSYTPDEHTIVTDGEATRVRALMIALANSRQYGNGALIAPAARLDDGHLDVVIIEARSPIAALVQVPRIFAGQIARLNGVITRAAGEITITSARPVVYHVDGEPFAGAAEITARSRRQVLRVKVPAGEKLEVLTA